MEHEWDNSFFRHRIWFKYNFHYKIDNKKQQFRIHIHLFIENDVSVTKHHYQVKTDTDHCTNGQPVKIHYTEMQDQIVVPGGYKFKIKTTLKCKQTPKLGLINFFYL